MPDLDLCYMPVTRQLELFRSGALSPLEVLDAQIARAEQLEPQVNAFTDTFFDAAHKAARAAADVYATRPDDARPLEGVTVAIKDDTDIAGQRTTLGSLILKDNVATSTHPVPARVLAAGALVHARTATPEFCCAWTTESRLHGVTRNPWDLRYTCSGSSGGSAAALAAGTSSLATGSDIGGSIRGPAAACGVVGFKPPYGRVPDVPPFNLDSYNTIGAMARNVADCALLQNVISGFHAGDIASLRERLVLPTAFDGVEGVEIAYTLDVGNETLADDVREHTMKVVHGLRARGAVLREVDLGWTRDTAHAARNYLDHLFGQYLVRACEAHPDLVCDYTRYLAERSRTVSADDFLASYEMCGRMYETIGPILESAQALVLPSMMTHEIGAQQKLWEKMVINDREVDSDYEFTLLPQFNMLGRLPALAVPSGLSGSGLPMGVQVVSRSYDDTRAFRVAAAVEQCFEGRHRPLI